MPQDPFGKYRGFASNPDSEFSLAGKRKKPKPRTISDQQVQQNAQRLEEAELRSNALAESRRQSASKTPDSLAFALDKPLQAISYGAGKALEYGNPITRMSRSIMRAGSRAAAADTSGAAQWLKSIKDPLYGQPLGDYAELPGAIADEDPGAMAQEFVNQLVPGGIGLDEEQSSSTAGRAFAQITGRAAPVTAAGLAGGPAAGAGVAGAYEAARQARKGKLFTGEAAKDIAAETAGNYLMFKMPGVAGEALKKTRPIIQRGGQALAGYAPAVGLETYHRAKDAPLGEAFTESLKSPDAIIGGAIGSIAYSPNRPVPASRPPSRRDVSFSARRRPVIEPEAFAAERAGMEGMIETAPASAADPELPLLQQIVDDVPPHLMPKFVQSLQNRIFAGEADPALITSAELASKRLASLNAPTSKDVVDSGLISKTLADREPIPADPGYGAFSSKFGRREVPFARRPSVQGPPAMPEYEGTEGLPPGQPPLFPRLNRPGKPFVPVSSRADTMGDTTGVRPVTSQRSAPQNTVPTSWLDMTERIPPPVQPGSEIRIGYGREDALADMYTGADIEPGLADARIAGGESEVAPVPEGMAQYPFGISMAGAEKQAIYGAIEKAGGNKTKAAENLGISLKTLHNKLGEYRKEPVSEPPPSRPAPAKTAPPAPPASTETPAGAPPSFKVPEGRPKSSAARLFKSMEKLTPAEREAIRSEPTYGEVSILDINRVKRGGKNVLPGKLGELYGNRPHLKDATEDQIRDYFSAEGKAVDPEGYERYIRERKGVTETEDIKALRDKIFYEGEPFQIEGAKTPEESKAALEAAKESQAYKDAMGKSMDALSANVYRNFPPEKGGKAAFIEAINELTKLKRGEDVAHSEWLRISDIYRQSGMGDFSKRNLEKLWNRGEENVTKFKLPIEGDPVPIDQPPPGYKSTKAILMQEAQKALGKTPAPVEAKVSSQTEAAQKKVDELSVAPKDENAGARMKRENALVAAKLELRALQEAAKIPKKKVGGESGLPGKAKAAKIAVRKAAAKPEPVAETPYQKASREWGEARDAADAEARKLSRAIGDPQKTAEIQKEVDRLRQIQRLKGREVYNIKQADKAKKTFAKSRGEKLLSEGSKSTAVTPKGIKVDTQHAIVEAGDLRTSHDIYLNKNPEEVFPSRFQPRERTKAASEIQATKITAEPDYAQLVDSPLAGSGAPIISPEMLVESGNIRTIALLRLYKNFPELAAKYKQYLIDNAARLGLDPEVIRKAKQPILVRKRLTEMGDAALEAYIRDANKGVTAKMSPKEQAKADARGISDDLLASFSATESGDIDTPANREKFLPRFLEEVGGNEASELIGDYGELNAAGITRVKNAIFAKAYGENFAGDQLIKRVIEDPESNFKNIANAMLRKAPRIAALKSKGSALDISEDLAKAVIKLSDIRAGGKTDVPSYLAQEGFLGEELTSLQKLMLKTFDDNARSGTRINEILDSYLNKAEQGKKGLFKEDAVYREELFAQAVKEKAPSDTKDLFDDLPEDRVEIGEKSGFEYKRKTAARGTPERAEFDRQYDSVQKKWEAIQDTVRMFEKRRDKFKGGVSKTAKKNVADAESALTKEYAERAKIEAEYLKIRKEKHKYYLEDVIESQDEPNRLAALEALNGKPKEGPTAYDRIREIAEGDAVKLGLKEGDDALGAAHQTAADITLYPGVRSYKESLKIQVERVKDMYKNDPNLQTREAVGPEAAAVKGLKKLWEALKGNKIDTTGIEPPEMDSYWKTLGGTAKASMLAAIRGGLGDLVGTNGNLLLRESLSTVASPMDALISNYAGTKRYVPPSSAKGFIKAYRRGLRQGVPEFWRLLRTRLPKDFLDVKAIESINSAIAKYDDALVGFDSITNPSKAELARARQVEQKLAELIEQRTELFGKRIDIMKNAKLLPDNFDKLGPTEQTRILTLAARFQDRVYSKPIFGSRKAADMLDTYINGIPRIRNAYDAINKSIAFNREMIGQLDLLRVNHNKLMDVIRKSKLATAEQKAEYIKQATDIYKTSAKLIEQSMDAKIKGLDPPEGATQQTQAYADTFLKMAEAQAEIATFNNQSNLAEHIQNFKEYLYKGNHVMPIGGFLLDYYVPFPRVKINLLSRLLDLTPIAGSVRAAYKLYRVPKEFKTTSEGMIKKINQLDADLVALEDKLLQKAEDKRIRLLDDLDKREAKVFQSIRDRRAAIGSDLRSSPAAKNYKLEQLKVKEANLTKKFNKRRADINEIDNEAIDKKLAAMRAERDELSATYDLDYEGYKGAAYRDILNKALTPGDQRRIAELIAGDGVGTALLMTGALLMRYGMMSDYLPYRQSESAIKKGEREQYEVEERPSGSIRVFGRDFDINQFQPYANMLILGGQIYLNGMGVQSQAQLPKKSISSLDDVKEGITETVTAGAKGAVSGETIKTAAGVFGEHPLMGGASDLLQVYTKNEGWRTAITKAPAKFVPSSLRDLSPIFGPAYKRRPNTKIPGATGMAVEAWERTVERLPYFRDKYLAPDINLVGEKTALQGKDFIDPTRSRAAKSDPTIETLREAGLRPEPPQRAKNKETGEYESEQAYSERSAKRGRKMVANLKTIKQSPEWNIPLEGLSLAETRKRLAKGGVKLAGKGLDVDVYRLRRGIERGQRRRERNQDKEK